jgi:hypothetical protein
MKSISPSPIPFELDNVKICAGSLYSDTTSSLVLLAKEENSSNAREVLVDLLYIGLIEALSRLNFESYLLIPMPSSKTAN